MSGSVDSNRKNFSDNVSAVLAAQVNGICPICGTPLFHEKKKRYFKSYELAHIYPLNPTKEEEEILKEVRRLSEDVNDEANVIPLCCQCHTKFDHPRTQEEYNELCMIKNKIIAEAKQRQVRNKYTLEFEIVEIINALNSFTDSESSEISYDIKVLDQKFNSTIHSITSRKIRNMVVQYYPFIKKRLSDIDTETGTAMLIASQIRTFYLEQLKLQIVSQQEIFENIVTWIMLKTKVSSRDAADIIVSFFIQDCEVF